MLMGWFEFGFAVAPAPCKPREGLGAKRERVDRRRPLPFAPRKSQSPAARLQRSRSDGDKTVFPGLL